MIIAVLGFLTSFLFTLAVKSHRLVWQKIFTYGAHSSLMLTIFITLMNQ